MRKYFKDPVNSGAFDNVTHGLGLGMFDVALDMVIMVIEQQIRILSGTAASDTADCGPPMRRIRRRHRKVPSADNEMPHKLSGGVKEQGKVISKGKGRGKARKKTRQETGAVGSVENQEPCKSDDVENNVLTLVSVGYETVSSGLGAAGTVWQMVIDDCFKKRQWESRTPPLHTWTWVELWRRWWTQHLLNV